MTFQEQLAKAKTVKIIDIHVGLLQEKGNLLIGKCPFHNDQGNPNFRVYSHTNSFYCFRCGFGGDVITYMRKLKNSTFMEAVKELCKKK